MNDEVNVAFETLPDDVFASLMEDAPPAKQPNASHVQGGAKPAEAKPAEAKPAQPAAPVETPAEPEKTPEELQKEIDDASDAEATQAAAADPKDNIDEAAFFKAKAQGLIDRGIWQEFDGMDTFEWTEENYGKLVEVQAEWKAEEKFEERVGKTGDIGKVIMDHIDKGGNPDEIIDLFKASKRIESYDIKTDAGKESLVKEYYTKVIGWPEGKTDKYVKSLVDAGGDRLTEEANDAKDLMDKGIQAQIKETQAQATLNQQRQQEQAKAWESNMTKIIKERTDLSDEDRREVHNAILNYNVKLQDGRVVNKFMVKFMEMQADPQKYIDLVRFVTDPEKYKAKVEKKTSTAEAKKNWEFIKGNQSLSRNSGTSHNKIAEKSKNDLVIDYRKLI